MTQQYVPYVSCKHGIEIGGPSGIFDPLYKACARCDGVNFSTGTIWEGEIVAGWTYRFGDRDLGYQFIGEATGLSMIEDHTYDFVLSSNCLEHVANPVRALVECWRVMNPGGALILALPRKETNFDHRRPTTTFEHLWDDYDNDVGEDDLTHLDEIIACHDLSMDPPAGTPDEFRARSLLNAQNRCLHHHVFDKPLIELMLTKVGFHVIDVSPCGRDTYAVATK
jgi:SAM-dependent methyltransferase